MPVYEHDDRVLRPARLGLAGAAALLGAAVWWRRHPSACPYGQRFWVQAPHPLITRPRLRDVLDPTPGEHMLEIGPGTGYYSLAVAQWLTPIGKLDLLDVQSKMLDHTLALAHDQGLQNIACTVGDARSLPYEAETFDAVYLTTVIGEIPDQAAALREIRRVLKPDGRLVVGELIGDPHWVSPRKLRHRAEAAGLQHERRLGSAFGYFARFSRHAPCESDA